MKHSGKLTLTLAPSFYTPPPHSFFIFFLDFFLFPQCVCCFTSLFHIKLLESLSLQGHRRTGAHALLFNASYMCRLQFYLALNFVGILHLDNAWRHRLQFLAIVEDTMDKGVSFLGSASFNKAMLPVCIVAFACCAFFNVYARIMATLGLEIHDNGTMIGGYQDAGGSELGGHSDQIREGRLLIKRALRETRRRDAAVAAARRVAAGRCSFQGLDLGVSGAGGVGGTSRASRQLVFPGVDEGEGNERQQLLGSAHNTTAIRPRPRVKTSDGGGDAVHSGV